MIKRTAILLPYLLLFGLSSGLGVIMAATPTPTPSNTLTIGEQNQLATIAPPILCNAYNPCNVGAFPFNIPVFPTLALPSPTIRPTQPSPTPIPATATPSITPTPTGTPPTVTPPYDSSPVGGLVGQFNDAASTLMAQSTVTIYDVNGTPQGVAGVVGQLGTNIGQPFAIARAMQLDNFAGSGGIISWLFLALAFVFLIRILSFAAPLILTFLRLVLQIIQAVKPF